MINKTKCIALALASVVVLPAVAQNSREENTETNKLSVSYEKPGLVISNRNFSLEFGGRVRGTASYDFGNPLDNPNSFTVYDIERQSKGNGGKFALSAQQSGLSLEMRIMKDSKNEIGIHFSGLFMDHDYGFELEELFATFRGFKVGYGYGQFCDEESMPYTIDDQGPNSALLVENAIFDYSHEFSNGIGLGIGAEMPVASFADYGDTRKVNQRVPDIPFYVQYGWGGENYVRLSGIVRTLTYRNMIKDKNASKMGWGVKLSGTTEIVPSLRAYWQAAYGEGISSYFQDFGDNDLDLVPAYKDGVMNAVKSWGGFAALEYTFSPKVFAGAGYSYLRNYAKNTFSGWDENYRNGQYVFANVFYNINSQIQWGIEYIYGQRKNMDRGEAHNSRLQTMLQISF